jgi:HAD superfamily hydrolase (TIGR01509 family)
MAATALLFDLDGTLWDSYPCYAAALGASLGCTTEAVVERLKAGENVVRLADEGGLGNAKFTSLCRASIIQLRLYAEVNRTLTILQEKGTALGVVTNTPQRLITPLLSDMQMDRYFGSVVCAARKPSPGGILRALAELNIQADRQVYLVGDSSSDAIAASRAGVSFAWAAYGYSAECPQQTAVVIERVSDLIDLV